MKNSNTHAITYTQRHILALPREGVECYMSGNCKSERLFSFRCTASTSEAFGLGQNFVDLRLIDADATGSARRADAAANFGEIWMDQCKWIPFFEGMSRILQKAAVQRGARGCCPSRTRSTEWVWVYR